MCGRYTLQQSTQDLIARFGARLSLFPTTPRYNIAPSQEVPAVVAAEDGSRTIVAFKWGLVPAWVKDTTKMRPAINARVESVAQKPSYKASFRRRRCLLPADGFYEWLSGGGKKIPLHISMDNGHLFAFAGLWDEWQSGDGEVTRSCAIITLPSSGWLTSVHERMPAILTEEAEAAWLDPTRENPADLLSLVAGYPEERLKGRQVSPRVNSARLDAPELLDPVTG